MKYIILLGMEDSGKTTFLNKIKKENYMKYISTK